MRNRMPGSMDTNRILAGWMKPKNGKIKNKKIENVVKSDRIERMEVDSNGTFCYWTFDVSFRLAFCCCSPSVRPSLKNNMLSFFILLELSVSQVLPNAPEWCGSSRNHSLTLFSLSGDFLRLPSINANCASRHFLLLLIWPLIHRDFSFIWISCYAMLIYLHLSARIWNPFEHSSNTIIHFN